MENNWVYDFYTELKSLRKISYELANIAETFYDVGNYKISSKLLFLSDGLYKSQEKIREINNKKTNDDLKQAQRLSDTILKACLSNKPLDNQ